ncbi:hypothetical protein [Streptomyces luteireticuli]
MARPGFGKRNAPGQEPRRGDDFVHLRPREASIAAFIDRLPEGAAVDGKSLAAQLPDYGQAACLTALRRLAEAGHLRRFQVTVKSEDGSSRWVTRTFFSRTPRDDSWWEAVRRGDVPVDEGSSSPAGEPVGDQACAPGDSPASRTEVVPAPVAGDVTRRPRSRAYGLLASLGLADPRMTLSAADCAALAPLVEPWFERGVTDGEFVRIMTAGLPPEVLYAAGFTRRRLREKLPPEVREHTAPRWPHMLLECVVCRAPGTAEALPAGICGACRGETPPRPDPCRTLADDVRVRVDRLRAINRQRERTART